MNTNYKWISGIVLLTGIGFLAGRCSLPLEVAQYAEHEEASHMWTCAMHPSVQQSESGSCPICGMDLIPAGTMGEMSATSYFMTPAAQSLASVETVTVERRMPEARIELVGTIAQDETRVSNLSARFSARIDQLFVNFKGVSVEKGEHLARVYSPQLLTAQREVLIAYRNAPDSKNALAAREKLQLWGLLDSQIDELLEKGSASDSFELKAPVGGVVVSKIVNEGDYVQTGSLLFEIADLSSLWLLLDAYESDLQWLRLGQSVSFSVEAYPSERFVGQISFIAPEMNARSRTVSIRVNVSNSGGRLKPGMFAKAEARSNIAKGGRVYVPEYAGKWISPMHPEIVKDGPGQCDICGMDLVPAESLGYVSKAAGEAPLVVPTSAVLRTGTRSIVYVATPNGDGESYEARQVVLGMKAGDLFLVNEGLEEGERIVTRGAFKIDSALQIQAKPSMMSMRAESILDLVAAQAILPLYLNIQDALASDDLAVSKNALVGIHEILGHGNKLDSTIHAMENANTLDEIRRPHFEDLTNALSVAIEASPDAFEGVVVRMNCPMAYPDRGADWLQRGDQLRNPYFGSSMLTCGSIVREY